jgi:hypothetical protein
LGTGEISGWLRLWGYARRMHWGLYEVDEPDDGPLT